MNNALNRFANPDKNIGGGDFATRVIAVAVLLVLSIGVLPQLAVPYPLLKIALLSASELGLMCVMLGMFFKAKTYFAGLQLFVASLVVLALASKRVPYAGTVVGFVFVVTGIQELITKRSRLNALLGVNSFMRTVTGEVDLLDAARLPGAAFAPAAPPKQAAPAQITEGKRP